MEFTADICKVHNVERTSQRGGDPQCTACYLEEMASMRPAKRSEYRIVGKEPTHGREWIIERIDSVKGN